MRDKDKQYKRQNQHIKDNYERYSVALPKGTRDRINALGEKSVSKAIKDALELYFEKNEK